MKAKSKCPDGEDCQADKPAMAQTKAKSGCKEGEKDCNTKSKPSLAQTKAKGLPP
jgi:hypothetical protein